MEGNIVRSGRVGACALSEVESSADYITAWWNVVVGRNQ
jgi:hypothetical protein